MKMSVFSDDAPYSLVEIDRRFRRAYFFRHHGDRRNLLKMKLEIMAVNILF
jgi:hypothetical protein